MRGAILSLFSVVCVTIFSVCLFLSDNLLMFWLFLELGTLSIIPSFFLYSDSGFLNGLFSYIVVSGISSSLIISGLLFEGVLCLSILGFLMKFGVFPFFSWVYVVFSCSNWLVIWILSGILKASFLFFSYFLSTGASLSLFLVTCSVLNFLLMALFFWLFTFSWVYYWCHVVVSSSSAFLIMAVCDSSDLLIYLFLFYVVWVSSVVLLFSHFEDFFGGSFFLAVFLLVSFPGSLSLFYKLLIGACILSSGCVAFFSWVVYNVSEQLFLVKALISQGIPRSEWSGVGYV